MRLIALLGLLLLGCGGASSGLASSELMDAGGRASGAASLGGGTPTASAGATSAAGSGSAGTQTLGDHIGGSGGVSAAGAPSAAAGSPSASAGAGGSGSAGASAAAGSGGAAGDGGAESGGAAGHGGGAGAGGAVECVPKTCDTYTTEPGWAVCGTPSDGCGSTLACGKCANSETYCGTVTPPGEVPVPNICVALQSGCLNAQSSDHAVCVRYPWSAPLTGIRTVYCPAAPPASAECVYDSIHYPHCWDCNQP
jgi:hypothetical protein